MIKKILESDMDSNPIFKNFKLDEVVEVAQRLDEKGRQRFQMKEKRSFQRAPYWIFQPTGKRTWLYVGSSGVTKESPYAFEDVWMNYNRVEAEEYEVPYHYRHARYPDIAEILIASHYPKASGVFKIYGNSNQIFADVGTHSIYFDPLIFSDEKRRTPEAVRSFFAPYCTMHKCCKDALAFLKSKQGEKELKKFFSRIF